MLSLFRYYPRLGEQLPHVRLGRLPTPVRRLETLGSRLGAGGLYVKCDDLTDSVFGGNKIRKLEFLLGEALREGATEVMTFGCAGSNHALATAINARRVGLRSISMLLPQPNAGYVGRNLLMSHAQGAELHHYNSMSSCQRGRRYLVRRRKQRSGRAPYVIPAGGSSALGAAGFVNAAFELADQVAEGMLPVPHTIYVAAGTVGTATGLILGLEAAGLPTRVVPVRVTDPRFASSRRIVSLHGKTNSLLRKYEPAFPRCRTTEAAVAQREGFLGPRYAEFSAEGMEAVRMTHELEGLKLEGTYTGKAFAALIADARSGELSNKNVLFWNTHNSRDFSKDIDGIDYHELPKPFHRYFEEPFQPLDREGD